MSKQRPGLRIISGKWRRRVIASPKGQSCRPTLDRIRETLFNWLPHQLTGWYCVDAFAGTGMLGLEALSRGADFVTFVEQDRQLANNISKALTTLDAQPHANVIQTDIQHVTIAHDIDCLFLDPPYDAQLIYPTLKQFDSSLKQTALVYVETNKKNACTPPTGWVVRKEKTSKHIYYALWQRAELTDSIEN